MGGVSVAYRSSPEKGRGESEQCLAGSCLAQELRPHLRYWAISRWFWNFLSYLRKHRIVRKRDDVQLT